MFKQIKWLDSYHSKAIITVLVDRRTLWETLTRKPKRLEDYSFIGNCTVWHDIQTGHRCRTHTEMYLADIWTMERHKAKGEL